MAALLKMLPMLMLMGVNPNQLMSNPLMLMLMTGGSGMKQMLPFLLMSGGLLGQASGSLTNNPLMMATVATTMNQPKKRYTRRKKYYGNPYLSGFIKGMSIPR